MTISVLVIIFLSLVIGTGLRRSVVDFSASLEFELFGLRLGRQERLRRRTRFAALTLDRRSSDQKIGWSSSEAEMWSPNRSVVAGTGRGGGGESGVAGGEPAHAGEPPAADDQGGFFGVVLILISDGGSAGQLPQRGLQLSQVVIARRELSTVRQRLATQELRPASPFELVAAIRAETMRTQEDLITESSARIAQLERDVSQKDPVKAEALMQDLFDLRHDLEAIRTSAAQAAESFANLIETMDLQEGLMQTDLRRVRNMQQGFRHLQHTADLEREYLQEMIDLFQTRVSTELNRFVRKVTAWGSIGIAWTVIVGLYGMNFAQTARSSAGVGVIQPYSC